MISEHQLPHGVTPDSTLQVCFDKSMARQGENLSLAACCKLGCDAMKHCRGLQAASCWILVYNAVRLGQLHEAGPC